MLRLMGESGVIVCAISGGADSMALFHGLLRVRELRKRDWTLYAAHLDHGIPHNSREMMALVESTANVAGVAFHGEFVDVPALSRETGESIEEAGRKARYSFLEDVCDDVGATVLAVAHHADDQAETILHRVLRGTGLNGLAGIPESRLLNNGSHVRLIRPLLGFRRSECAAYLERRELAYMHDDTNDDVLAATRNRIRHDVMASIEREINPQVVAAMVRLGELSKQTSELIDVLAQESYARCCVEALDDAVHFDATLLANERELIRMQVVGLAIDRLDVGRGEIGFERLQAASRVIGGEKSDAVAEMPGGVRVVRRGRFVIVSKAALSNGISTTGRADIESARVR